MHIIGKNFLITEFSRKKYRNNRIAKNTLRIIKNKQFKIKPISKQHRYFTRKYDDYNAIAWTINSLTILFNERYKFDSTEQILETCVHEVNHCLNLDSFKNDSTQPMKLEVMAYIAEYCFKYNKQRINRQKFIEIKEQCFNDYRKFFTSKPQYVNKRVYNLINYNTIANGKLF